MTKLQKDILTWTRALRSGEYKQAKYKLQSSDGYCCLGVACDIFIPDNKKLKERGFLQGGYPTQNIQPFSPQWIRDIDNYLISPTELVSVLAYYNEEMSFDEIADILELVFIHGAL